MNLVIHYTVYLQIKIYTSLEQLCHATLLNFLLKLMSMRFRSWSIKKLCDHYKTKRGNSQDLIDKIKKAETFNKGYDVTELLASTLDMNWHSVENEANLNQL
jgi:hypothetical protein